MTFKETEFPSWVHFFKSILQKNPNPFLIQELVKLLIQLYEKTPLYPGIVEMCLSQGVKSLELEKIKVGEKIYFQYQGSYYAGEILSKNSSEIKLRVEHTNPSELSFSMEELKQVTSLNQKILEELWPSLIFEQEQNGV